MIELFVVVALLGAVVALFATQPQSPVAVSSNRETAEQVYTNVVRLFLDPGFLSALEEAVCTRDNSKVRSALEASLGPQYVYNFTVRLAGTPPPCLACVDVGGRLLNVTRPLNFKGPYTWSGVFRTVLPSGAQVEVFIGVGRP